MRMIKLFAAALVAAASMAVAENPTYSGSLRPDVGSPRGYIKLVDKDIPPDARVRLVESYASDGTRVPIPQRIVRRVPTRGELIVALDGLTVNTTYDVVIDRPGHRPLVAPAAYRAEHPTITEGGMTWMNEDGRAGPGQVLTIWHGPAGRRLQVEVGGIRARIVSGPYRFDRWALDPDIDTTFVVPKLPPGPAEVIVSDDAGWSASAGWVQVLAERREVTFRAGRRRVRTDFQEARGGSDWFRISTSYDYTGPVIDFWFDLESDVRTAALPATYTQNSAGATLSLGVQRSRAGPSHIFEVGEWTLTVDEIADGEVRGTFSARLVDDRKPHRTVNFTDGRFRVPFAVYE